MANRDVNHEGNRRANLESLPAEALPLGVNRQSWNRQMLNRLLNVRLMRFLLGNIAFLKNPRKSYRKYFVCDEKRILYLRIFKCGSTSMLRCLLPCIHKPLANLTLTDIQIDSIAHYLERNVLDGTEEYTSFTIIRNPLERLVSAYLDIFTHHDYGDFLFGIFKKGMTFKELLQTLAIVPDHLRGPHFISQSAIIKYSGLTNIMCFKLRDDNERLLNFLSRFDLQLGHSNKSVISYDFRNFYDAETLQLAFKIYKCDFTDLGYSLHYEELLTSFESK
jgi:hypothetical protein